MARFIFFTKTPWNEPPRLRHQLARLLAAAGHDILFFEKPLPATAPLPEPHMPEPRITVVRHRELVHHRLRLTPVVHHMNARAVKRSVSEVVDRLGRRSDDVVVNFNYDYWFLGEAFAGARVLTIINDDFVTGSLFGYTAPARWALARTCKSSYRVLTVSTPLQERLAPYADAELFLPWAEHQYVAPRTDVPRDTLLFWGFINYKLDFPLLRAMATALAQQTPARRILLAGPQHGPVEKELAALTAIGNVTVAPPSELDRLPLDRVIASIIPYRSGLADIDAIMLPNKALHLLAAGVPLMISGMPHFLQAPFVFRFTADEAIRVLGEIEARRAQLQPAMREFVAANGADVRMSQFLRLVA